MSSTTTSALTPRGAFFWCRSASRLLPRRKKKHPCRAAKELFCQVLFTWSVVINVSLCSPVSPDWNVLHVFTTVLPWMSSWNNGAQSAPQHIYDSTRKTQCKATSVIFYHDPTAEWIQWERKNGSNWLRCVLHSLIDDSTVWSGKEAEPKESQSKEIWSCFLFFCLAVRVKDPGDAMETFNWAECLTSELWVLLIVCVFFLSTSKREAAGAKKFKRVIYSTFKKQNWLQL